MRFFNKNKEDLSDDELLVKIKETGKSEYFNLLYERYIPLIYGLCLKYLHDSEKSQDAVIDIFESLSPKISTYEIGNFKNWIYSVVRNHCFHVLKENKKEYVIDFDSQFMESDIVLDLFSEETNNNEREAALSQCLERLPELQRVAVCKFFYEDKSYADIVEEIGYNLKSVKSFLQNGKRNLKNCVEKKLNI